MKQPFMDGRGNDMKTRMQQKSVRLRMLKQLHLKSQEKKKEAWREEVCFLNKQEMRNEY